METKSQVNDDQVPMTRGMILGHTGGDVAQLQRSLGCVVSGVFDEPTQRKVLEFQRSRRLPENGSADRPTLVALGLMQMRPFPLGSDEFFGTQDDGGHYGTRQGHIDAITDIQRKIGLHGTGVYDNVTRVAVMRWQGIRRLPKTGRVSVTDWAEMF